MNKYPEYHWTDGYKATVSALAKKYGTREAERLVETSLWMNEAICRALDREAAGR